MPIPPPASMDFPLVPPGQRAGLEAMTFPAYQHLLACRQRDNWTVHAQVAAGKDGPAGLLLAVVDPAAGRGELLSLFVSAARRNNGIGRALLAAAADHWRGLGLREVETTFTTGTPGGDAFERVLAAAGWQAPVLRTVAVKCLHRDMVENPPAWLKLRPLPGHMQVLPWVEITAGQRAELAASQAAEHWIPDELNPFDFERRENPEPGTSVALAVDGCIRGWWMNHRLSPVLLRFTCCYIHPSLQRTGRLFHLTAECIRRMPEHGFTEGIFTVAVSQPFMHAFAKKRIAPHALYCRETKGARLVLAGG
jgi:GNAT superfamily N-acetyltransferase